MRSTLTFAQAVKLLEPPDSKIISALDKIAGGVLLLTALAGQPQVLALLEAKSEVSRLGQVLIKGVSERLSGTARYARTEKLIAAHSVIVVTAFFDALAETEIPVDLARLKLDRATEVALSTGRSQQSKIAGSWIADLLAANIPAPSPQNPFEYTIKLLRDYYYRLFANIVNFIKGLEVWDTLDDTRRAAFDGSANAVVTLACTRYEEHYRRLAATCLEFFFWANFQDHQASRHQISQLDSVISEHFREVGRRIDSMQTGLAAITTFLGLMDKGCPASRLRENLARVYEAQLKEPAFEAGPQDGPVLPALNVSYINPRCRIRAVSTTESPADDSWWREASIRDDLQSFLMGYLTGPEATAAPLVVLGQPGSGKSVFTRVLAARLATGAFVPIRVELRRVPANSLPQDQIEQSIRELTGTRIDWPELVDRSVGALPVVMMDGFDELLQATGVSRSDYLEQIRDFQRREESLGRPVAVIVTTRIAVADRARFPAGSVVIRLEEFDSLQIGSWIDIWNSVNAGYFDRSGLEPLPPAVVLRHPELAAQPLLLILLALYDSEDNALQKREGRIGRAYLYEQLLTSFARREVRRLNPRLEDSVLAPLVDRELDRLAVFACGMFNRGAQSATDRQLTTDLTSLLGEKIDAEMPGDFHGRLTPAQLAVGRFYFLVHESQATLGDYQYRTYEFMHTTFGEYLVARIVAKTLQELSVQPYPSASFITAGTSQPSLDLLYALLSFVPVTSRAPIVTFLIELADGMTPAGRLRARDSLIRSLSESAYAQPTRAFAGYAPARITTVARQAAYSANVVTITACISERRSLMASELFPESGEPVGEWRKNAYLWKSQMLPDQWQGMTSAFRVLRMFTGDRPDLVCTLDLDSDLSPRVRDLSWWCSPSTPPLPASAPLIQDRLVSGLLREAQFMCDPTLDHLAHALDPVVSEAAPEIGRLVTMPGVGYVSLTNVLAWLRLVPHRDWAPMQLISLYRAYLDALARDGGPEIGRSIEIAMAQLCDDLVMLPHRQQAEFLKQVLGLPARSESTVAYSDAGMLYLRLATERLGVLGVNQGLGVSGAGEAVYRRAAEVLIMKLTEKVVINTDELISVVRQLTLPDVPPSSAIF